MKIKNATKDLNLKSNDRLFLKVKSPFTPKLFKDLIPIGFNIYTFNSGFKKKNEDLLIIIFKNIANVACKYSLTTTPSAPIIWDKQYNKGRCKALIVNSGNANAHTGKIGLKNIKVYIDRLCKYLKCSKNEILVSSTGVIGEQINPNLICKKIKLLPFSRKKNLIDAAKAIWTTDTYVKTSVNNFKINNQDVRVYGFAKGSGMISPKMGTMLAYIFIDCFISSTLLKKILSENIEDTFNSITVDSDTSTSDTIMFFANPIKKINLKNSYNKISKEVKKVMHDLAMQVIKDGEGIKKLINVKVTKARTKIQAKKIAFSIANSPLVKTALAGEDANWGRVVMAIGKTYENIEQEKITIKFGDITLAKKGKSNNINLKNINKYMKNSIIRINVSLGIGNESIEVYGNDLNYEYIRINADYRS